MKGFVIGLIAALVVLILAAVAGLNRVVGLDEEVEAAWAQVENQLQRRFDLVPNLVNTVRGYAAHEREVFTTVTELRSRWAAAPDRNAKIQAADEFSSALSRLLVVAENYPQLKADQNFLALQAQLEGTENRIAVERRRYNEKAREFNYYIRSIPGKFWAGARGLTEPKQYFEADAAAREAPRVEF